MKQRRFTFSIVEIPPGSTLLSTFDEGITATVVNDDGSIRFRHKVTTLSPAAVTVHNETRGYKVKALRGPCHWMYKEEMHIYGKETLQERRERMEGDPPPPPPEPPQTRTSILYVIGTPSIPDYVRIGTVATMLELNQITEAQDKNMPAPCDIVYRVTMDASSSYRALQTLQDLLHWAHVGKGWYELDHFSAIAAMTLLSGKPLSEMPSVNKQTSPNTKAEGERLPQFRFFMVGIEPGAILRSTFDSNIHATVLNKVNSILFRGKATTLSVAALEIHNEREPVAKKALRGPRYWTYKGETLEALRDRMERRASNT